MEINGDFFLLSRISSADLFGCAEEEEKGNQSEDSAEEKQNQKFTQLIAHDAEKVFVEKAGNVIKHVHNDRGGE